MSETRLAQRNQRDRAEADPAERRGIAHMRDAGDQRGEHQRRDDHLDQPQEQIGDDREIAGDGIDRGRIGQRAVEDQPGDDAGDHGDRG